MMQIEWGGQRLQLLAQRAVYWQEAQTLILADAHFGKTAAFRRGGVPVPEGSVAADLRRLDRALRETSAKRLIILGDLFHAKRGRSTETLGPLTAWRESNLNLQIMLVRGNHDRGAGDPPPEWSIRCVDEPHSDGPFTFAHYPTSDCASTLAGHLHPSIVLHGPAGQRMRTPAFWFGKNCAILPAFGSFTGTHSIRPASGDRVFAVGPEEVVEIHRRLRSSSLHE